MATSTSLCSAHAADLPFKCKVVEYVKARCNISRWLTLVIISTLNLASASISQAADLNEIKGSSKSPEKSVNDRLAELNATLGYRGWNVPFPAFNDTLTQDAGGIRSALAEYGIGFIGYGSPRFFANLLDTPTHVQNTFPKCPTDASVSGALCAGNRAYFGQSPDAVYGVSMVLTYDLRRLGIPDGLLAVGGSFSGGDHQAYSPNIDRLNLLSWYQTAFDRRMEIEFGYLQGLQQFVGQTVGGNFANPFGPSGSIPALLGLSAGTAATPMFRSTFHMTGDLKNGFYNEFAVSRSVPPVRPLQMMGPPSTPRRVSSTAVMWSFASSHSPGMRTKAMGHVRIRPLRYTAQEPPYPSSLELTDLWPSLLLSWTVSQSYRDRPPYSPALNL
ncbi:hypothetical protein [Bradyrhizobium erythrophlei]|uniref:hypothetical protein n=1 Tax=Bradyrhizobium erythrophlei TaxID=1437360 RepID=UPI00115FFC8D|nr:hypothetical protein [Bradyrhizobium erythrophlei]